MNLKSLARFLGAPALVVLFSGAALGQTTIYTDGDDTGGTNSSWSDDLNWSNMSPATIFTGGGFADAQIGVDPVLAGGIAYDAGISAVNSLTFNNTVDGSLSIVPSGPGQSLEVKGGGIINNSSFNQTLSVNVTVLNNTTFAGGTGGLTFGDLTIGTNKVTTTGNVTITGANLKFTIHSGTSYGQIGPSSGTLTLTNSPNIALTVSPDSADYKGTLGDFFQLVTGYSTGASTDPTQFVNVTAFTNNMPLNSGLSWISTLTQKGILFIQSSTGGTVINSGVVLPIDNNDEFNPNGTDLSITLNGGELLTDNSEDGNNTPFSTSNAIAGNASPNRPVIINKVSAAGATGGTLAAMTGTVATYTGIISDQTGGTFTNSGTLNIGDANGNNGTVVFTGANTYAGATNVVAGRLKAGVASVGGTNGAFGLNSAVTVGAAGTLDIGGFNTQIGSLLGSGNVTNSGSAAATLSVGGDNSSPAAFSGLISDGTHAFALTKIGTGTLTLSGTDSYSGATTVSAGTLAIASTGSLTGSTAVTVSSGAFLTVASGGSISSSTALADSGTTTFNNATTTIASLNGASTGVLKLNTTALTVTGGGTFAGAIQNGTGTGSLTVSGGALTLNGANSYTGATSVTAGTLAIGTTGSLTGSTAVSVSNGAILTVASGGSILATTALADSGSTTFNNASTTIASLNGAATGTLTLNSTNLTVSGGGTFGGIIKDGASAGKLTVSSGTLVLNGANTYTGATTVSAGTLKAGSTTAFGNNSAVSVGSTGTLDIDGSNVSIGSLTGSGSVTNSGGVAATLTTGGDNTSPTAFSGIISNGAHTVALTKVGTGTETLSGADSYTGNTTVSAGTLAIGATGSLTGSTNVSVSSGATLSVASGGSILATTALTDNGTTTLNNATTTIASLNGTTAGALMTLNSTHLTVTGGGTFAGGIGGSTGALTVSGGTLMLNGANSYGGTTSVTGGTLAIGATGSLTGSTNVSVSSGATLSVASGGSILATTALTNNGTTTLNNATTTIASLNGTTAGAALTLTSTNLTVTGGGTYAGGIGGTGALTVNGGTLALNGTNGYTGNTLVSAGTLAIGATGSLTGSTNVSVSSGAALTVASGGSISSTTALTDSGSVTFNNTAQSLASLNGSGSTLALSGPTTLTVSGGGTFGGVISGTSGALTVTGGTLTLNGADSYGGATSVTGGTLAIGATGSLTGSTNVTVGTGAALSVASGGSILATTALTNNGTTTLNNATTTIASLNGTNAGAGLTLTSTNLTVTGGGTYAGGIGGTGALTVNGGTLGLNGTNSYTGNTSVTAGTLAIGATGSLTGSTNVSVSSGAALTVANGGTIKATTALTDNGTTTLNSATQTIASLTGASTGLLKLNSTNLTVTGGGTFAGSIQNGTTTAGALTVNGGTLNLTGANSYTGNTSVTAGTLAIGATGSLTGSTNVSVSSGATLSVASGGSILGTTALTDNGTTTFSGATASVATLNGTNTAALLTLNSTDLTVTGTGNSNFAGTVGGTGGVLTLSGAVTDTLSGANTYTGGTSVASGTTLVVANTTGSGTGTGTVSLMSGADLEGDATGADISGMITMAGNDTISSAVGSLGTGNISVNGTGNMISAGTVGSVGTITTLNGSAALAVNGTLNGTLNVGGGTFTGTGTAGAVTVGSGGILNPGGIGMSGTLRVGTVTFQSGSNFDLDLSGGSSDMLTVTGTSAGALTIGSGAKLTFNIGSALTQATYVLADVTGTNGTLAGTFAGGNVTNLPSGYQLVYTGTELELTQSAPATQTLGALNPSTINIITNASTTISSTLGNTGTSALNVSLSGTNNDGTIGTFTSSSGTTVAPTNGTSTVGATVTAGGTAGTGTYSLTNTDSGSSPTSVTSSGTINVYNHSAPGLSSTTGSIGTVITGATVTTTTTLNNAAGTNAGLQTVSLGGLTTTGPTVIAAGSGNTLTSTATVGTAGAYSQGYTISTEDDQSITGANMGNTNQTYTVSGTVLSHSNGALSIGSGNNQTVIVGATNATVALSLTNMGATNASMLISSLGAGVTGVTTTPVAANGSAAFTGTLNASTLGAGQTQTFTINVQDEALPGQGSVYSATSGQVTLNVENHSLGSLSSGADDFGQAIVGATVADQTTDLQNAYGYRAGLQIVGLDGLTTTGPNVIAEGSSNTLSATVDTSTAGAYSKTYTVSTSDDQSVLGATSNSDLTFTVTGTILDHSNGALAVTSGNDQTVIIGATGITADLNLTNLGADNASMLVNSLGAGVAGPTATVGANGSQAYVATLNTSTANAGQTQTFTINVQDEAIAGQGMAYNASAAVTVNVLNHSSVSLSSMTGDFGIVHEGAQNITETTDLENAAGYNAGLQIVDLDGLTTTGTNLIAAGGSDTLTATVDTGTAGAVNQAYTIMTSDDQSLQGFTANADQTFTVTGNVYSGQSVWNVNGSGSWGTLATGFGTSWGATQGSPGLDPNFVDTDTATFDNTALATGTQATVSLNGASPSLNAITFNTAGAGTSAYTIAQGSGGTLKLNNGGGTATINDTLGSDAISAPIEFDSNVAASVANALDTLTLSGNISGGGGLTINGPGTVLISGAGNTFSGPTTIGSGTLMFGADNALIDSSVVTNSGGTINLNGHPQTFNNFSSTGGVLENTGAPITVTFYEGADPVNASQITGNIAVNKTGPGLLALTNANNNYTGGTTITAGTLEAGSAMALGTSFVNNVGGTLGSYGSQHVINVAADYTQGSGGTLAINIDSAPTSNPGVTDTNDVLNVAGSATLGGKLAVSFINHYIPTKGQQYVVVETTDGIDPSSLGSGFTDPTIVTPFGVTATGMLTDDNNDLTLTVLSTQLALTGTLGTYYTPNRAAIAAYLSSPNLPSSDSALYTAIVNVVSNTSQDALPQTVADITDQFNPAKFGEFARSTAFNNAVFSTQMLDGYLANGRSSTGDFLAANGEIDSSALTVAGANVDPSLAQVSSQLLAWTPAPYEHGLLSDSTNPVVAGVDMKQTQVAAEPVDANNFNVFVAGNVVLAQNFSQSDLPHSDSTTGGVQIGGDYRITPHLRAGVLFGYSHTDSDLDDNGSKATVDSYAPGVYASFADSGWYANAVGSYGFNSYTEDRAVLIGGSNATAHGAPDGDQIVGDLDGGYDFHFNNLTLGPLAGVQYSHLDVNSFSEDGAESLGSDLSVNKQQADSLRSRLGGHMSYLFQTGKILLTPHLDASWQHEFMDDSRGLDAQLVNVVGSPFTVKTSSPSRDSALLDAGLNAQFNGQVSVFGDYLVQVGQSNYFGQSVQAGVKIGF